MAVNRAVRVRVRVRTTFPRLTTGGYLRHARKDVVAVASAKRLQQKGSAGVKQLGSSEQNVGGASEKDVGGAGEQD